MKKIRNFTLIILLLGYILLSGLFVIKADVTESDKLAVINQDAGYTINDQVVNYGQQLIGKYSEYSITSLSEAQSGKYGGFVVIPTDFSQNIISINSQPTKSMLSYGVVNSDKRDEVMMQIVDLEMKLNKEIGTIYVNSVLNEFHTGQDQVNVVKSNNTNIDEAILGISSSDFIEFLDINQLNLPTMPSNIPEYRFTEIYESVMENYKKKLNVIEEQLPEIQVNVLSDYSSELSNIENAVDSMGKYTRIKLNNGKWIEFEIDKYQISFDVDNIIISGSDVVSVVVDGQEYTKDKIIKIDSNTGEVDKVKEKSLTESSNSQSITLEELLNHINNNSSLINTYNNHVMKSNATYYLDSLYIDAVNQYISELDSSQVILGKERLNELIQLRVDNYKSNVDVAINQFNEYSGLQIVDIFDYIEYRNTEFVNIAQNYDFNQYNINDLKEIIVSSFVNSLSNEDNIKDVNKEETIYEQDKKIVTDNITLINSGLSATNTDVTNKLNDYKELVDTINQEFYNNNNEELVVKAMDANVDEINQAFDNLEEYVVDTQKVVSDNITDNQQAISQYYQSTTDKINNGVDGLQSKVLVTTNNSNLLLDDFASKLAYTRNGNVTNNQVVEIMVSPTTLGNDQSVIDRKEDAISSTIPEQKDSKSNSTMLVALSTISVGLASYIVIDKIRRKKEK